MPRRTRKPWTGVLAKPMTPPLTKGTLEEMQAAQLRWAEEWCERYAALRQHYNIDETESPEKQTWALLLKLIDEHVPGFRYAAKPGRRADPHTGAEDLMLFCELFRAEEARKSVNAAAARLERKWGKRPGTIGPRYYELKRGGPKARQMIELLLHANATK